MRPIGNLQRTLRVRILSSGTIVELTKGLPDLAGAIEWLPGTDRILTDEHFLLVIWSRETQERLEEAVAARSISGPRQFPPYIAAPA